MRPPTLPSARAAPRCTCAVAVRRGSVVRPVRRHRWTCPSCGADNRKRFVAMALTARPVRMITLTLRDTTLPDGTWTLDPNGRIRADWQPDWHPPGLAWGHVYQHRDGTARFAPQTWCPHCLRHVGRLQQRWVQRFRCLYPDLQYQWVTESTTGRHGAIARIHRHMLVTGIPRWLPGHHRDKIAADWQELGGNLDLGRPARRSSLRELERLAHYASKYMTKAATRVAAGYRRWGRSRGYAPDIPMREPYESQPWGDPDAPTAYLGDYHAWQRRHGISPDTDDDTPTSSSVMGGGP